MTPTRITRSRTKGFRLPPGTICITRPGKYGNPFKVGETYRNIGWLTCILEGTGQDYWKLKKDGITPSDKEEAVRWFKRHLETKLRLWPAQTMNDIRELAKAKHIACWCKEGELCHGDVWLEKINELNKKL